MSYRISLLCNDPRLSTWRYLRTHVCLQLVTIWRLASSLREPYSEEAVVSAEASGLETLGSNPQKASARPFLSSLKCHLLDIRY